MTVKTTKSVKLPDLPKGIQPKDLESPSWKSKGGAALDCQAGNYGSFELWYIERFGWVIPTLQINSGRHRYRPSADTRRTYAISVDGKPCRVGHGPHVKATITVYVRVNRRKVLQPYLDLMGEGLEKAHDTRDRISTRRMQGSLRRFW